MRKMFPIPVIHDDGSEQGRAILYMVLAMLVLPGLDACAKLLSDTASSGQIAFYRFAIQFMLLLPVILYKRTFLHMMVTAPVIQLLRGVFLAFATLFFFSALRYMPMAETIAIFFVSPLIVTLLSAVVLGETLRRRRLIAIAIGFIGALIIIRPSHALFGWAVIWPLCAATCFALYVVFTRKISGYINAWEMQLSASITALIVMACALTAGHFSQIHFIQPSIPDSADYALILGLGIIGTIGHILLVNAFRLADASLLAPFQYLEIVAATMLGFAIFGDIPDQQAVFGTAVIIISGLYLTRRESKIRQTIAD